MQRRAGRGQPEQQQHDAEGGDRGQRRAIGRLTVARKAIAPTVAAQGGSTFQMNKFSTAKAAFEVAVTRPVSVPGRRSAK